MGMTGVGKYVVTILANLDKRSVNWEDLVAQQI
jgi:hypothetical protein